MSGDVITTLKEYLWVVALVGFMIGLVNAYFGGGWGRKGITSTFALTRTRKLKALQARHDLLQRLRDSDREYYGYLLSGILGVLFVFGGQLGVEGLVVPELAITAVDKQLMGPILSLSRVLMGIVAAAIALDRLSCSRSLQHYDTTMASLDRAIARLEAKLAGQPRVGGDLVGAAVDG